MQGWIKLHRVLLEKPIWMDSTPVQKTILITLIMMANHKEKEWEWQGDRYKAEPGQFITSLEGIANNSGKGVTIQNVRTALKRFEKYGFLTNKSTNKNRLITIVNWEFYQRPDDEANKQNNKHLTSNQQATNKQLTTNKNDKNENNDKKINSPKQVYDEQSIYFKLAKRLSDSIKDNLPEHEEPNLQKWSDDMRKIVELDKREPKQVVQVIDWAQSDDFWWKNIMSPSKLRKQYLRLIANMKPETNKQPSGRVIRTQEDPRDREIQFQKWVAAGNNPEGFDWITGKGIEDID